MNHVMIREERAKGDESRFKLQVTLGEQTLDLRPKGMDWVVDTPVHIATLLPRKQASILLIVDNIGGPFIGLVSVYFKEGRMRHFATHFESMNVPAFPLKLFVEFTSGDQNMYVESRATLMIRTESTIIYIPVTGTIKANA